MPLSSPTPHHLVEGAIGEVIPAELLQRTAAFGDSAVEALHTGHKRDWRGYVRHEGLEYAIAGACFVMPAAFGTVEGRDLLSIDLRAAYCQWLFGFTRAPQLVRESVYVEASDTNYTRHFIEAEIAGREQSFLRSMAEYAGSGATPLDDTVDVAVNAQRHRIYVGSVAVKSPSGDPTYTASAGLIALRRVFLWGLR